MVVRHCWMASALVVIWAWGWLLGHVAVGETAEAGKEIYQQRCQACHGPDGKGNPQMMQALQTEIQDLTMPTLWSKPDTELLQAIADGKGKMPPFGKVLNGEARRAVLDYIRQLATGAH